MPKAMPYDFYGGPYYRSSRRAMETQRRALGMPAMSPAEVAGERYGEVSAELGVEKEERYREEKLKMEEEAIKRQEQGEAIKGTVGLAMMGSQLGKALAPAGAAAAAGTAAGGITGPMTATLASGATYGVGEAAGAAGGAEAGMLFGMPAGPLGAILGGLTGLGLSVFGKGGK
jgi:hypothetical protein